MKEGKNFRTLEAGDVVKSSYGEYHYIFAVIIRNGDRTLYAHSQGWYPNIGGKKSVEGKESDGFFTAHDLETLDYKIVTYRKKTPAKVITMDEVAEKFGVCVKNLKIKK
jgi:hypothetical protein